jgi:hypothetical protein
MSSHAGCFVNLPEPREGMIREWIFGVVGVALALAGVWFCLATIASLGAG